ncbi:antirestriction protein ArdA [Bacterioplanoides sp.]|uniref:antirestriction protein ArdA n=1 Tax=Bacterioplanoides sp. TaxID=2066072 RepID=UPI003AFFC121
MARVHYWELSNYNNGNLIGKWFDLEGITAEEHAEQRTEWLKEIHADKEEELREAYVKAVGIAAKRSTYEELEHHRAYVYEEWILGDVEDVPDEFHGEYGIDDAFFEYQEALEATSMDKEAFDAGVALGIPLDEIKDAYFGEFTSDEALGDHLLDSGCMGEVPEHLVFYIDTERLGCDFAINNLMCHDIHYFHNNW